MITRLVIFAAGAVAFVAILAFGRGQSDTDAVSLAEREALENTRSVTIETETEGDETRVLAEAADAPELTFEVEPADTRQTEAGASELLTVEGYDPQRVRFLLQDTDLSVEVREDYLSRLETAFGNPDQLAAVLTALRAELTSG